MAESRIPVDLTNPGQVFACLGFMEAADVLYGDAYGAFDWRDVSRTEFLLVAGSEEPPVQGVLEFLATATVQAVSPAGSELDTARWSLPSTRSEPADVYPFPLPSSPATLVARLVSGTTRAIEIGYWGADTGLDNVKFWAGSGGYPGAGLVRDALDLLRDLQACVALDPFAFAAPQSSSFRFDWRRDYVPLDVGFSPNAHTSVTMTGYPLVELCAAIGLSHARPARIDKLHYRYQVLGLSEGVPLDVTFHRAALGCADLAFPSRRFRMTLDWPGQENQARCIADVFEEA